MPVLRPDALPAAAAVADTAAIMIDTGAAVEKATPSQLVDAAIPLATQAEAEAGTNNAKRVTPLRVKQAIDALADPALRTDLGDNANDIVRTVFPGFPAIVSTLGDFLPTIAASTFFGIKSNGSTDDTLALKTAIEAMSLASEIYAVGREIILEPGATTVTSDETVLRPGVVLNGRGGRLRANLNGGNEAGLRLMSYCGAKNLYVDVNSTGVPGSQAGAHAAVLVGELYGLGGTVGAPSEFVTVRGAWLDNCGLHSNKDLGIGATAGGIGLQVMGDVAGCSFTRIRIPTSGKMIAGMSADWGIVGVDDTRHPDLVALFGNQALVSDSRMLNLNKAAFNGGIGYTTHPYGNLFRGWVIGDLSRPFQETTDTGTYAMRLSGAHGCIIEDVIAERTTESAFVCHIGDLGYEYARAADKAFAGLGNKFRNCQIKNADTGIALKIDSFADNVDRGVTGLTSEGADTIRQFTNIGTATSGKYTALHGAAYRVDTICEQVNGYTEEGANASFGVSASKMFGGELIDCSMHGFKVNFRFNASEDVTAVRSRGSHAWTNGIEVVDYCKRIKLIDTKQMEFSGQAANNTHYDLYVRQSDFTRIEGGVYGADNASGRSRGAIYTSTPADGTTNVVITGTPHVQSGQAAAVILGSGGSYPLWLLDGGFSYGPNVGVRYGGCEVWPVKRSINSVGTVITDYETNSANTLSGLTVVQGDKVWFTDAAAGSAPGRYVVTGGNMDGSNLNTLSRTMPVLA